LQLTRATSVSQSTGYSAFFLLYGREAVLPIEAQFTESQFVDLDKLLTSLQAARECARENIEIGQIRSASYHDLKVKGQSFKIGDIVVCRKFVRKQGLSPKLAPQYYYGPYTIVDMPTEVTAIIQTQNKCAKMHKERVHIEKLKLFHPRTPGVIQEAVLPDGPVAQEAHITEVSSISAECGVQPADADHPALLLDAPDSVHEEADVDSAQPSRVEEVLHADEQIGVTPVVSVASSDDTQFNITSTPVATPRYSLRSRPSVNYKE
jgi:hypothetical protein